MTIDDRAAAAVTAVAVRNARAPAVVSFPLTAIRRPRLAHRPATEEAAFSVARQHLSGFRDACIRLGYAWDRVPMIEVPRNYRNAASVEIEALFRDARPDAVVAMSDQLGLGILDVIGKTGLRVPEDITVSGWDDSSEAEQHDLTTIGHSLHEQGVRCAKLVLGKRSIRNHPPGNR